ncbi:MAG TPA: hypothetical protein VLC51_07750 [Nitrospira sp.]|nr:hypothetical protein [Nitrospira sp.]
MKVNPEDTLRQAINRFVKRFQFIEQHAAQSGRAVGDLSLDEMNRLWDEAKTKHPAADTRL